MFLQKGTSRRLWRGRFVPLVKFNLMVSEYCEPICASGAQAISRRLDRALDRSRPAQARRSQPASTELSMKTVWIYVADYGRVGDEDWVKVFSSSDAAEEWLEQNDPEGVAWEYPIHDKVTGPLQ